MTSRRSKHCSTKFYNWTNELNRRVFILPRDNAVVIISWFHNTACLSRWHVGNQNTPIFINLLCLKSVNKLRFRSSHWIQLFTCLETERARAGKRKPEPDRKIERDTRNRPSHHDHHQRTEQKPVSSWRSLRIWQSTHQASQGEES